MQISVVIATCDRNDLLINRCLKSVYEQSYFQDVDVVVCVDTEKNELIRKVDELKSLVDEYRKKNKITDFPTRIIGNKRTKFHSGTGAWNTAFLSLIDYKNIKENANHFVAILDDDDSWDSDYLQNAVPYCKEGIGMVVSGIRYIEPSGKVKNELATKLKQEEIYVKNPGVFGSNMLINLDAFFSAGGFDESMRSTTDRDFLIRYADLCSYNLYKTKFCDFVSVNHFADANRKRVTSDRSAKKQGLDIFYYKYQKYSSFEKESLERAEKLFGYRKCEKFRAIKTTSNLISHDTPTASKINLIIGIICFDGRNLRRICNSFINPLKSDFLKNAIFYIFTNQEHCHELRNIIKEFDFNFILDDKRSGIDSIAKNRTQIRQGIFDYIIKSSEDFVTWLLDDDLELYDQDYAKEIAFYKEKEKSDVIVSTTTGEPPLPFLLTLRRNLNNILFCTEKFKAVKAEFGTEYYYDLTEDFRFLEMPLDCGDLKRDEKIKMICEGKSLYLIDFFENEFGKSFPVSKDDIVAGGNVIIFNKEFLRIPNYTPDGNKYNRRSDCNWRILCQKSGAKITRVYLPVKHVRENKFNLGKELEKLEKDLIGNRFYRCYYKIIIEQYGYAAAKNEALKK